MAGTRGWCVILVAMGLLLSAAAVDVDGGLSVDFHAASCLQLEGMVRAAVQAARGQDMQVTAGLLRIFFHDCLPQGCDASILLSPETRTGPNKSLQQGALDLIEAIRRNVHAVCGPTVSCADIIALATRDAVNLAGGPFINMPQGRTDSLRPATPQEINLLPGPSSDVNTLLALFSGRTLTDPADVVALSGGHTVGKASCGFIRRNDPFSQSLAKNCRNRQSLDVITPDAFDNAYFVALKKSQGVLFSDQSLSGHPRTAGFVTTFATNQTAFFQQFAKSMVRLGNIRGAAGEIRRNCFQRNTVDDIDHLAPGFEADASA